MYFGSQIFNRLHPPSEGDDLGSCTAVLPKLFRTTDRKNPFGICGYVAGSWTGTRPQFGDWAALTAGTRHQLVWGMKKNTEMTRVGCQLVVRAYWVTVHGTHAHIKQFYYYIVTVLGPRSTGSQANWKSGRIALPQNATIFTFQTAFC